MKESLQEVTQRALIDGYKNLKENKSKKVEVTKGNQELYYYEIHFDFTEESGKDSDGYSKFFKSSKDVEDDTEYITNLAIEENILDEDDLADIDYIDYAQKIDKEEYERATRTKTENKKVEAYNYNWRDDIDEVENTEANDELVYTFAENLIATDPDYADYDDPWEVISDIISIWKIEKRSRLYDYLIKWYGSEEEMKKHIRSFYETNNAIYFETGVGYSIWSADLLGGTADGQATRDFDKFVDNNGKKEESKKVEEAKLNFINNVDELPDMCYGLLPSDNSIIIIKKGESGYYETDLGSPENAEEVVNDLNERMDVTPDQRFTMEIRSINNNWEDTKTESKKLKESYNVYTTDYNEDGTITKEFYMSFDTYKEAEMARQGLQDEGMDAWIEELNESKKVTEDFNVNAFDKTISIEDNSGDTLMQFKVSSDGSLYGFDHCEIADEEDNIIRLQQVETFGYDLEESKEIKAEDVDNNKVNLYDTVWDQISFYDEEYAQEQGIDKLDDEDVYNIIAEIMSRPDVQDIIREEIEDYAGRKNN